MTAALVVLGLVIGAVLLVSFVASGALPWIVGVFLVLAAVGVVVLGFHAGGHGWFVPIPVLVLAGAWALTVSAGGWASGAAWALAALAFVSAAIAAVLVVPAIAYRRAPVAPVGTQSLVGAGGKTLSAMTPTGIVRVNNETWTAQSLSGPLPAGAPVHVVKVEGLRLLCGQKPGTSRDQRPWARQTKKRRSSDRLTGSNRNRARGRDSHGGRFRQGGAEYQRVVLFRLGRVSGARGPGLILINPITDRISWVDLREQYLEVPHQTAITQDNAAIAIDFIIFYKVLDPLTTVLAVQDFKGAGINIASTTLRSVVGDMTLDDVLSKREQMNDVLRAKLDDVTERWGVKVTNVEVREIKPPPAVLEAMTRQMGAERTRRALVTEAEGQKSASITVAEGEKQSAILQAEGERQAAELRAQGFAAALSRILEVAGSVDKTTMTLQYLETLKQIGTSPSTKFVIPVELTTLLAGVVNANGASATNGATPGPVISSGSASH